MSFKRVSKREAKRLWLTGKPIWLCPHKMHPQGPFSQAALFTSKEWIERASLYKTHPTLWKGSVEETAWHLMQNHWKFYNASYETGYYPAYYVEI